MATCGAGYNFAFRVEDDAVVWSHSCLLGTQTDTVPLAFEDGTPLSGFEAMRLRCRMCDFDAMVKIR